MELPQGWVEKISRKREMKYYFNELTGETTWTKPVVDGDLKAGAEGSSTRKEFKEESKPGSSTLKELREEVKPQFWSPAIP